MIAARPAAASGDGWGGVRPSCRSLSEGRNAGVVGFGDDRPGPPGEGRHALGEFAFGIIITVPPDEFADLRRHLLGLDRSAPAEYVLTEAESGIVVSDRRNAALEDIVQGRAKAGLTLTKPVDGPPGQRWLGLVLAVLTSLLWAGNGYSIARGASALPLSLVNAVRYLMAALGLGVVWLWRARKPQSGSGKLLCSKKALRPFLLTAVIEAFFGSSIFVYAMSHGDLSVAAPLSSLAPLPSCCASSTRTEKPRSASSIAAESPASPPPTMATSQSTSPCSAGCRAARTAVAA